ncbi:pseudouridine-5'-phosphate glycosidase [Hermetia illucens]|uniref:pseudouridine-5'-phosphate glycosidase n=1 Tax=Hermetia illucens TaxID=343691 RepID=UPI0018CC6C7E|nr:pseudouridine-5'-phosphate glycosidase [Hermetia illucens]
MFVRFGKQIISAKVRADSSIASRRLSTFSNLIDVHPDVRIALNSNRPVVALESTIITHGMPQPQNLETALQVEDIIRSQNVIPATIAIINGRVKVGLDKNELNNLASLGPEMVFKCSRRDLGYVLSKKLSGGTTVAGTSIIANMVGIRVFATGGIGGVHRDGHISMDVSADLIELGRTPICVVSSGIKSILDIPRTLEYLETQGVCVAAYQSDTGHFPAFYTRSSGVKAPYNLKTPQEAALMIKSSLDLQLQSGILIGVPIPKKYAADEKVINDAIEYAVSAAKKRGIAGKEVTPFVLEAVSKVTAGKSLESNIGLIKNNAYVASQIAVALSNLKNGRENASESDNKEKDETRKKSNVPVVVGASILDICMMCLEDDLKVSNGFVYIFLEFFQMDVLYPESRSFSSI